MVMRDEREISIVRRQLNRLGMTISEHDPAEPPPPDQSRRRHRDGRRQHSHQVRPGHACGKADVPIIALIGTETPSRLKWLLDLQPASFLIKPLRSAGLYTALVVAFDCRAAKDR